MNSLEDIVKGKRIAVVGNSTSIFDKNYGAEIDANDLVLRFNKPAVFYNYENIEKTHGTKFDLWAFVSFKSFTNTILADRNTPKRLVDTFSQDKNIIKLTTKYCDYNKEQGLIYPLRFNKALINDIKQNTSQYRMSNIKMYREFFGMKRHDYNCTTGLYMIHWLSLCAPAEVNIYGFDFKKTPTFSERELFQKEIKNRIDIRCKHNFELEELYVKNVLLKNKRNFRIHE